MNKIKKKVMIYCPKTTMVQNERNNPKQKIMLNESNNESNEVIDG